jgi:AcrR family transcriptional regulator
MSQRRQEIVDAAMEIADKGGLDAVSMRTVADSVGVTPMALYRHFKSKHALLDDMVERLVTSLMPERVTGTWDERLTDLAHAFRDAAQRHPWSAQLMFSRPAVTPDAVRSTQFIYAALREAGVPESQVGRLERLLTTFVYGYAASEALGRFANRPHDFNAEFAADLDDLKNLITMVAASGATGDLDTGLSGGLG